MRKRTSDYSSDTDQRVEVEEEDVNLLRRPSRGALAGFKEAKNAYENGTDEVRRLLMHECNLIYECNACRNMFRSLTYFINHKRSYCCTSANFFPEEGNFNGFQQHRAVDNKKVLKSDTLMKSKTAVAKVMNGNTAGGCLSQDMAPGNSKKTRCGESLGLKTEVDQLISKMKSVLTSESGKSSKSTYNFVETPQPTKVMPETNVTCETCNMRFQSDKALRIHNQKKHIYPTYGFQCPACPLTFLQPAAVVRHLGQQHKKSVRRIRMMRESFVKRRIQPAEISRIRNVTNRELKRLQLGDNALGNGGDELGEPTKIMSKCIYCEKSFERRAALSTHLMSCRLKLEALEKQYAPVEKRTKPSQQQTPDMSHNAAPSTIAPTAAPTTAFITAPTITIKEEISDSNSLSQMFANLNKQSYDVGLKTVTLDNLEELAENTDDTLANQMSFSCKDAQSDNIEKINSPETTHTEHLPQSTGKNKSKATADRTILQIADAQQPSKLLPCRCKICNKRFNALSNLRRHISMFHYRSRKFGCKLCEYRAFRRYDIVNHLGYVHKMTDDRETMSEEFVSVHEVHYSKDDMDSDIVLISEETEPKTFAFVEEATVRTYEKRVRRKKTLITASSTEIIAQNSDVKSARPQLKRYHSQHGSTVTSPGESIDIEGGILKAQQKRPIRNRIKPVDKDFVYDLSTLIKEELPTELVSESEQTGRQLKRRNTLHPVTDPIYAACELSVVAPLIAAAHKEQIKGTVQRLTLLLVQQGRAASATLPKLPAERPQMRPRLTSTCRVDMQAVPVFETSDLAAAQLKPRLLEDSFLEKISKRSASGTGFKIKPCLQLQHSALDTLLQKVDSSYQNNCTRTNNSYKLAAETPNREIKLEIIEKPAHTAIGDNVKAIDTSASAVICTDVNAEADSDTDTDADAEVNITTNTHASPEANIPCATSPPATPRKRITLVQRLAENKAKQRDSLLRSALEN